MCYNKNKAVSRLNLFESEIINISKIHTVNVYEGNNRLLKHYPVNLHTYELIFYISGNGMTHFSGRNIADIPDSLRYLPKGISDGEYYVQTTTPTVCIDIYFDTSDPMPDYAIGLKNVKELKPLFLKINNIWKSRKSGFYVESMSILYEIIRKIKSHTEKYNTNASARKISPSYNYMLEHFSEHDFDYKAMCKKSELSYDYFKELFIKQYGVSPVKFVTVLRIEKAKEMLLTKHYTITEIADICGFENVYYFSTVFKKQVGVSPSKYNATINKE